jgi:uroporphyrinogen-III synthase
VSAKDTASGALAGRRVLVTRAAHQTSELAERLRALGATPILIPTIEIAPLTSYAALDAALRELPTFDCVAFTSANAVQAFHARAQLMGVSPQISRIASVGNATERALQAAGLRADVIPPVFTAESLAETLAPEARGKRFLLVLAENAPATLHDGLIAAGAEQVTIVSAYSNRMPESSLTGIASLLRDEGSYPDAVTFTSASTASNLLALLQAAQLTLPRSIIRASIGPITSCALRELDLPPHVEARESTIAALVECLVMHFRQT